VDRSTGLLVEWLAGVHFHWIPQSTNQLINPIN